MDLPPDMDPECIALCEALNMLPGIETINSCCGHGTHPYRIFFMAESLDNLAPVAYFFDEVEWFVDVTTDDAMSTVTFLIQGPVGQEAYYGATVIAGKIREYVSPSYDPMPLADAFEIVLAMAGSCLIDITDKKHDNKDEVNALETVRAYVKKLDLK